ncbi:MAG: hypothetical protein IT389_11505 [Nitrospira sp.]|nr:hypothetical protein [Nitrospira sp.]
MAIGQNNGVFNRATVEAALAVDPFGGAYSARLKEPFAHQQSAASWTGRHRQLMSALGAGAVSAAAQIW